MLSILEQIGKIKIIPVVAIKNARDAAPLGEALLRGGLPCAEITFRTPAALDTIKSLARYDEILLGAGTVLTIDQIKQAVDAGALFIVSPGFNDRVVQYCIEQKIPITPGCCTPTDLSRALDFGLNIVKFFPADAFGGLKTLKAISAPFQQIQFIPTGGINPQNLPEYLRFPQVIACGGSWMVQSDLISEGRFTEITRLTKEAVEIAAGI